MKSVLAFVMVLAAGCSSADADAPSSSGSSSSSSSGTNPSPDAGTSSGTSGTSSGSSSGSQIPANCNGDEGGVVPTEPVALQAWLGTGKYKCWTHESAKHPSTGPHGGDIQTYLIVMLRGPTKSTLVPSPGAFRAS